MMGLPTCSVGKLYPTFVTCHGVCPSRFLCPWDFLGKNTGMACHFLLQEDLLMQGLNLGILPASPALAGRIFTTEPLGKPYLYVCVPACLLIHLNRVGLCDPMDCGPPASSIHRILQASILEWVAMPFSRRSS